ncbi:MAG: agmatinase family protein [Polyangiaceae bacterium]
MFSESSRPPPAFDPSGPAVHDGLFGLPHTAEEADVVVIPVPWEPTTSYRKGTASGPANVLEASRQVDLFDRTFGRPYERGIAMLPIADELRWLDREANELSKPIIERGGADGDPDLERALARVNALCRELDTRVEALAASWLDRGRGVGVLGGDHASPLGLIRAVARRHPGVGVLHLDAHADLRRAYEGFERSHASIMFNVHETIPDVAKIVQVGIRDLSEEEHDLATSSPRIACFFDDDLAKRAHAGEPWRDTVSAILSALPERVHLSFDIDGLDPSLCPGTGTPVPGGLDFRQVNAMLAAVADSGRMIVGFDLCEVAGGHAWDGNVGARLLYKMIGAMSLTRTRAGARSG